jgi:hypothetical protein
MAPTAEQPLEHHLSPGAIAERLVLPDPRGQRPVARQHRIQLLQRPASQRPLPGRQAAEWIAGAGELHARPDDDGLSA